MELERHGVNSTELRKTGNHNYIIRVKDDDIYFVSCFQGNWRNETVIEVEKRRGTSYTLKGDDANIDTVISNLTDEGWKLEQKIDGNPQLFVFFR